VNCLFEKRVPGTLFSNLVNDVLNEGLIASWDSDKLNQKIVDKLGSKVKEKASTNLGDFLHSTKYGKVFTTEFIVRDLNDEDKQFIEKICDKFGYYVSKYTTPTKKDIEKNKELEGITKIQIEPRYPVKVNKLLEGLKVDYLFHITLKSHLPEIKRTGLLTKDTETEFYHPSTRIYYFFTMRPEVVKSLQQTLARSKGVEVDDLAVLKVKYDPSVDYYIDDTTTNLKLNMVAVFTLNPVHAKNIIF
jgi:hypothetical protein